MGKWPESLTLVRHGRSAFNDLKKRKKEIPEYRPMKRLYYEGTRAPDFDRQVLMGTWPGPELRQIAVEVYEKLKTLIGGCSDFDTPLADLGHQQAQETGVQLQECIPLPHLIYVSPYLRTRQTLEGIMSSWPALKGVQRYEEERIREQEHGLAALFSDWMLYEIFNPQQALLYRQDGPYAYQYLNGESVFNVRDRIKSFTNRLVREHGGKNILEVTHHLTILSTRSVLERWGRERFIAMNEGQKPINCGVTIYRNDPDKGKHGRLVCAPEEYNMQLYTCPTGEE